jgi:hypothetical protein
MGRDDSAGPAQKKGRAIRAEGFRRREPVAVGAKLAGQDRRARGRTAGASDRLGARCNVPLQGEGGDEGLGRSDVVSSGCAF